MLLFSPSSFLDGRSMGVHHDTISGMYVCITCIPLELTDICLFLV